MTRIRSLAALFVASSLMASTAQQSPQAAANDLLAADRAFSDAGSTLEVVDAIAAMFADDVMAPALPGKFAKGKAELVTVMRSNALNAGAKASWVPLRAGVSADGQHGFTWGFMTVTRGETPPQRLKYLAYWMKTPVGWRIMAYRRTPSAEGEVVMAPQRPAVPDAMVAPVTDPAVLAKHRASLAAAEKAFSDTSQIIGLGPAFKLNGRADAINMGGPTVSDFVRGNENIGQSVGAGSAGKPSPVSWSAGEGVLVASSGDLGVTFGIITPNGAPAGTAGFPFFTIWKRENGVWKYIAE
jgi:ketosteroid isomerase-like protein